MKNIAITLLLFLSFTTTSKAIEPYPFVQGWIGLWNNQMMKWGENENQLSNLCPKTLSANDKESCIAAKLLPKEWDIKMFAKPDIESSLLGVIKITVIPGSPFLSSFNNTKGKQLAFKTDLYDPDWGYGPYFHQTILDKKGNWIKISITDKAPLGWINTRESIQSQNIYKLAVGDIYLYSSESIVITHIDKNAISYRLKNKADMWCSDGEPPKPPTPVIKTINKKELYHNGHLKLKKLYTRGCY